MVNQICEPDDVLWRPGTGSRRKNNTVQIQHIQKHQIQIQACVLIVKLYKYFWAEEVWTKPELMNNKKCENLF